MNSKSSIDFEFSVLDFLLKREVNVVEARETTCKEFLVFFAKGYGLPEVLNRGFENKKNKYVYNYLDFIRMAWQALYTETERDHAFKEFEKEVTSGKYGKSLYRDRKKEEKEKNNKFLMYDKYGQKKDNSEDKKDNYNTIGNNKEFGDNDNNIQSNITESTELTKPTINNNILNKKNSSSTKPDILSSYYLEGNGSDSDEAKESDLDDSVSQITSQLSSQISSIFGNEIHGLGFHIRQIDDRPYLYRFDAVNTRSLESCKFRCFKHKCRSRAIYNCHSRVFELLTPHSLDYSSHLFSKHSATQSFLITDYFNYVNALESNPGSRGLQIFDEKSYVYDCEERIGAAMYEDNSQAIHKFCKYTQFSKRRYYGKKRK